jgi:NhaA family Na+:H+ antiporter
MREWTQGSRQTSHRTATVGALTRLDRAVDEPADHSRGGVGADMTPLEYLSYACPRCRAANGRLTRSAIGSAIASATSSGVGRSPRAPGPRRAAELTERPSDPESSRETHITRWRARTR